MDFFSNFLLILLVADLFLVLLGLIKPTLVVWWEAIQNRRRVIDIYGRIALVLWVCILILEFFDH